MITFIVIYLILGFLLLLISDHGLDSVGDVLFFLITWPICLIAILVDYFSNENNN